MRTLKRCKVSIERLCTFIVQNAAPDKFLYQSFSASVSIRYSHFPDALKSSWVNPLVLLHVLWRIAEVSSLLDRFHAT